MKRYSYTLLLSGILICTALSSCKDSFLEVDQKQRIVAKKISDYDMLMNSRKFYTLDEGGWQATVLLGDDVAAESDFLNGNGTVQTQRLFHYEDVVYEEGQEALDLKSFLNNLYVCNKVIMEVPDAIDGTELQKRNLIAEAKATRAWLYLQMINFYAKPYQVATSATDPGFPIIKTADISIRYYSRNTVQEVYDLILQDLTEAIPDLPIDQNFAVRMTKPAAEAILGKTYLFMHRFSDALPHFDAAFTGINQQRNPAKLYDYNIVLGPEGSFLPISYNGPNGPGNNPDDFTEALLSKTYYEGSYQPIGNDGLVLSESAQKLYEPNDFRLEFYSATFNDEEPNPAGRVRKYGYTYVKFGIQLPDLYLMRAECRARLNNLSGAMEDLLALRSKRMPDTNEGMPASVATNQRELVHFIIDERTREFAAEGYRWFDMRRLYKDPLFGAELPAHIEYYSDAPAKSFPLKEERLTLRLPSFYIVANPGMVNNP